MQNNLYIIDTQITGNQARGAPGKGGARQTGGAAAPIDVKTRRRNTMAQHTNTARHRMARHAGHARKKRSLVKQILALVGSAALALSLISLAPTALDVAAEPRNELGAESACPDHVQGEFSGVPACMDAGGNLHICENNFPDENFRSAIQSTYQKQYVTQEQIDKHTMLNNYNHLYGTWNNLQGIEFFRNLTNLLCPSGNL